jgi:DNA repair exonuclease SbcCD ATPase subunit
LQDDQFREIPMVRERFEAELAEVERRLGMLRDLQPLSDRCQALARKDVPELQQRLQCLERALERAADALDAASADATEAQHALQVHKHHGHVPGQALLGPCLGCALRRQSPISQDF